MPGDGLSVLILAGGRSTRMGQDKLWLSLNGVPLVQRVAERLVPLAREVLFCANAPERFEVVMRSLPVPARIAADIYPGAGPLAGLHAGLSAAAYDLMLVVAGDMPFVNRALIEHMISLAPGYDVVIPQTPNPSGGQPFMEPLHALYRRSCIPALMAQLAAGERRVFSFYPDVRARFLCPTEVRQFDPDFMSFFNVNTPEDWETAQRRMSSR